MRSPSKHRLNPAKCHFSRQMRSKIGQFLQLFHFSRQFWKQFIKTYHNYNITSIWMEACIPDSYPKNMRPWGGQICGLIMHTLPLYELAICPWCQPCNLMRVNYSWMPYSMLWCIRDHSLRCAAYKAARLVSYITRSITKSIKYHKNTSQKAWYIIKTHHKSYKHIIKNIIIS